MAESVLQQPVSTTTTTSPSSTLPRGDFSRESSLSTTTASSTSSTLQRRHLSLRSPLFPGAEGGLRSHRTAGGGGGGGAGGSATAAGPGQQQSTPTKLLSQLPRSFTAQISQVPAARARSSVSSGGGGGDQARRTDSLPQKFTIENSPGESRTVSTTSLLTPRTIENLSNQERARLRRAELKSSEEGINNYMVNRRVWQRDLSNRVSANSSAVTSTPASRPDSPGELMLEASSNMESSGQVHDDPIHSTHIQPQYTFHNNSDLIDKGVLQENSKGNYPLEILGSELKNQKLELSENEVTKNTKEENISNFFNRSSNWRNPLSTKIKTLPPKEIRENMSSTKVNPIIQENKVSQYFSNNLQENGLSDNRNLNSKATYLSPLSVSLNVIDSAIEQPAFSAGFVSSNSHIWYCPRLSREDAEAFLEDKEPGVFLVRQSATHQDNFALALRIDVQDEDNPSPFAVERPNNNRRAVRHFLIETSARGVRLCGSIHVEPHFPSLAALIYQHCITPLSLPCLLRIGALLEALGGKDILTGRESTSPVSAVHSLPTLNRTRPFSSSLSLRSVSVTSNGRQEDNLSISSGALGVVNQVYRGVFFLICSVPVENLSGEAALERSVLTAFDKQRHVRVTESRLAVDVDGVTLTDLWRKVFFREQFPAHQILYAGQDSKHRKWKSPELDSRKVTDSRIFGIVVRKEGLSEVSNTCLLFCQCNVTHKADEAVGAVRAVISGFLGSRQ